MQMLAVFLSVFSLVFGLLSCSQNSQESKTAVSALSADEPGWKTDTSPITFDWYIHFSWFATPWGAGDVTSKYVTEKTGVSINFVTPAGNEAEKLNTLIAGDQLPDFITLGWWEGQVNEMIDGGLVSSLDELADQYDPYFFKVADSGRLGWYTQADGHVYGYPNASYSPADYEKNQLPSNQTFLVRKDMYEALGKPDMRTPEGFLDALRKAKAKFPEVNSLPLIPFGMNEFTDSGNDSLQDYLANFLAIPKEKNGRLYDRFTDPEYKRWLETFRQARQEGLITTDVFVDKRSQMEEKIAQGRYFCMLFQRSDIQAQQSILYSKDPNSIYMAVDGPANSQLEAPKLAGGGISGWTITLISKRCKDPARAIRFMSYLLSEEGQKDFYLGEKGVTWDTIDGKDQFLPEVAALRDSDRQAFDKKYGASMTYWMLMDNPLYHKWEPAPVSPFKEMEEWTYPYTVSYAQYDNMNPLPDTPEGIIGQKITQLQGKTFPALLNASSEAEFNQIWDSWVQKKQELGIEKLLDWQMVKLADNKKKLGL